MKIFMPHKMLKGPSNELYMLALDETRSDKRAMSWRGCKEVGKRCKRRLPRKLRSRIPIKDSVYSRILAGIALGFDVQKIDKRARRFR